MVTYGGEASIFLSRENLPNILPNRFLFFSLPGVLTTQIKEL